MSASDRLVLEWLEVDAGDEFDEGHLVCQIEAGVAVWAPQQAVYIIENRGRKWLGLLTDPDLAPHPRADLRRHLGTPINRDKWIHDPARIGAILAYWNL